ncbi:hypothetical protein KBC03_05450 [Patescibacteria group bacterium]|nr:hypothetical protein [Patescibacteria group bacterium]
MLQEKTPIQIYTSRDGNTTIEVELEKETIWLSQKMMATLFECSIVNISLHLKSIFKEQELAEN